MTQERTANDVEMPTGVERVERNSKYKPFGPRIENLQPVASSSTNIRGHFLPERLAVLPSTDHR
eukprot:scaffold9265_cov73-Cylindrotheca_fusiformis.AAC.1